MHTHRERERERAPNTSGHKESVSSFVFRSGERNVFRMDSQLAGFSSTSSSSPFDEPPLVDSTSMDMDLEDPIHPHDADMRGIHPTSIASS